MGELYTLYSSPLESATVPAVAQNEQTGYTVDSAVIHSLSEKPYLPTREAAAAEKNILARSHSGKMSEITREELSGTLSVIEERMDKRVERMERDTDRRAQEYRHELSLRDEQIRREQDLRQESFRSEQAARDAALAEKFSGFLGAQAERDKALEKIFEARFERVEKDISSIKADVKTITTEVQGIKVTMAKYLGGAIVIGAIASAALGAALKQLFP